MSVPSRELSLVLLQQQCISDDKLVGRILQKSCYVPPLLQRPECYAAQQNVSIVPGSQGHYTQMLHRKFRLKFTKSLRAIAWFHQLYWTHLNIEMSKQLSSFRYIDNWAHFNEETSTSRTSQTTWFTVPYIHKNNTMMWRFWVSSDYYLYFLATFQASSFTKRKREGEAPMGCTTFGCPLWENTCLGVM